MSETTLYSFPFSCSLVVKLVLAQHSVPFETQFVKRGFARKVKGDFDTVNPKRKVPALQWRGELLTEIVSILSHLDRELEPTRTTQESRIFLEWNSFLATEVQQQVLAPIFDQDTPEASRNDCEQRLLPPVLAHINDELARRGTRPLIGATVSGADAYLMWSLLLLRFHNPKLIEPSSAQFLEQMNAHSFVRATLATETKQAEQDQAA